MYHSKLSKIILFNVLTFGIQKYYNFGMQKEVRKITTPKKMGRPTEKPKKTQIAVRFDDETLKILDDYCKENNVSRAEGTRRAIHKLKK